MAYEQTLPTEFPNLQALFQNGMPEFAALNAGDQSRFADENNAALQQAYQGQQAQTLAERPLQLQKLMADNAHTQALTGLLGQQATAAGLGNDFTSATQAGKIGETNAGYKASSTKSAADNMEQEGRLFGGLAAQLKSNPNMSPWEKAQLVREQLGSMLPDHPAIQQGLITHADDLADHFQKVSDESYANTAAARKAEADEQKRLNMIKLQGENQMALEQMRQDGRLDMSKLKVSLQPKPRETMTQLEARWRDAALQGDVQAQAAVQNLEAYGVEKARASALVGDALKRTVLDMTPPAGPTRVPIPPRQGGTSNSPDSPPGTLDPIAVAREFVSNPGPEGSFDPIVTSMSDPQRQQFVDEVKRLKADQAPTRPQAPPQAVQMLKGNPSLAAAFDAKYGAGAAARALGK